MRKVKWYNNFYIFVATKQNRKSMGKFILISLSSFIGIFIDAMTTIVLRAVEFVKECLPMSQTIDHSGRQTFGEGKVTTVAYQAKAWLYSWFNLLQRSPSLG